MNATMVSDKQSSLFYKSINKSKKKIQMLCFKKRFMIRCGCLNVNGKTKTNNEWILLISIAYVAKA